MKQQIGYFAIIIYTLYIISGTIKTIMLAYNMSFPIDISILSALFLLLIIILTFYKYRDFNRDFLQVNIYFLLFFAWMLISSIYTPSYSYWSHKIVYFLTNFVAFIFPLIYYREFDNKWFFKMLILFTTIIDLIFVINVLPDIYINEAFYKASGMYLDVATYSGLNILLFVINRVKFKIPLMGITLLLLNLYTLVASGGRGGLIFTVLLLFIYMVKNFNKYFIVIISSTLALALAISMHSVNISKKSVEEGDRTINVAQRSINRLLLLYDNLTEGSKEVSDNKSVNERLEYLEFCKEKIFENPVSFLFGYGNGSFSREFDGTDRRLYPHNIVLEILFEMGVVGLILFLLFYTEVVKNYKYSSTIWAVVYLTLNSMKSSNLTDIRLLFAIMAIMILEAQLSDEKENKLLGERKK